MGVIIRNQKAINGIRKGAEGVKGKIRKVSKSAYKDLNKISKAIQSDKVVVIEGDRKIENVEIEFEDQEK